MNDMEKYFVTFYSPGTFVAETSTRSVDEWDVAAARELANEISERYGATPYAFRFTTRSRGPEDLDSKQTKASPTYYLGGVVRTIEEVRAAGLPEERILLSNMESNRWDRIVTTTEGWMWTQPLEPDDVVLAS